MWTTDGTSNITTALTHSSGSEAQTTNSNKVFFGSSDYLVLNMNNYNHNRVSSTCSSSCNTTSNTNANYYFENDTNNNTTGIGINSVATKGVSRLTKKLAKHKKTSYEFPADEITEGASTIDASVTDRIGHENDDSLDQSMIQNDDSLDQFMIQNDDSLDHSIIQNDDSLDHSIIHAPTTATTLYGGNLYSNKKYIHSDILDKEEKKTYEIGKTGRGYDEMRNDENDRATEENIVLLDVSVRRTSASTSSNDNHLTGPNPTVAAAKTSHPLTATSNSSIPTNHSFGTVSHQRPPLPTVTIASDENTVSRYNHYDWSYTEENSTATLSVPSSTAEQRRRSHTIRGTAYTDQKQYGCALADCCDDSTLETTAISNTSMDVTNSITTTPDTSFETTTSSGPVVVTPTQPEMNMMKKNKIKKKVTINDSQPKGKSRSMATPSSLRPPLEPDTLVIVEDDAKALEFRHTSLILQYASVELANYFVECNHDNKKDELDHNTVRATRKGDDSTIQYTLHVKVQDANDWRSLQPFLEPHAVQPAVVTPYNLPVLLPWFQQLKLNVLLQECDMQFLCHLVPPPLSPSVLDQFRSSVDGSSECVENVDYVTIWNTIQLGEIAVKAGLERTAKQAFIVAATWFKRFPNIWLHQQPQSHQSNTLLVRALNLMVQCLIDTNANDSVDESQDLDISFESTDSTTWESMFQPPEASFLFAAMISYLPIDCVDEQGVYNLKNVRQLLMNPLCPYLIREGIQKKEATDQVDPEYVANGESHHEIDKQVFNELHLVPVASSDENIEMIADNETILTENLSPAKVLRHQHLHDNPSNTNSSNNTNASLLQVAEELHAGWNSLWMKLAVAATSPSTNVDNLTQERDNNSNSLYHVLSNTVSDQQGEMLLLQSPKELSEWLHVVWDKLCHPPIFGTRYTGNHKKDAKKRAYDTPSRTILPSVSNNKNSVGGSQISVLRSNPNLPTTQMDQIATKDDDDETNLSTRRTFSC